MKITQFDHWDDYTFGGSGMVGSFHATLDDLREKFGEPTFVGGQRIDVRWLFQADNGTVFTIYNDRDVRRQTDNQWFIGGFGGYDKKTKANFSYELAKQVIGL